MNEYFVACILLVLIFFSLGLYFYQNPGSVNSFYGYRTPASKRNQDTWDEANVYAGRCLMLLSIVMIIMYVLSQIFFENTAVNGFAILGIFALISLVIIIFLTERRLKKIFFKDGKRKPNR